jgi:hypothetical protein
MKNVFFILNYDKHHFFSDKFKMPEIVRNSSKKNENSHNFPIKMTFEKISKKCVCKIHF